MRQFLHKKELRELFLDFLTDFICSNTFFVENTILKPIKQMHLKKLLNFPV